MFCWWVVTFWVLMWGVRQWSLPEGEGEPSAVFNNNGMLPFCVTCPLASTKVFTKQCPYHMYWYKCNMQFMWWFVTAPQSKLRPAPETRGVQTAWSKTVTCHFPKLKTWCRNQELPFSCGVWISSEGTDMWSFLMKILSVLYAVLYCTVLCRKRTNKEFKRIGQETSWECHIFSIKGAVIHVRLQKKLHFGWWLLKKAK